MPAQGHFALQTRFLDRFLAFDKDAGLLDAEPGISFRGLLETFLPMGFSVPVTPGTMFVTLGGAVAGNVHGKNHNHCGSLENFVAEMDVNTPTGLYTCSPDVKPDLFNATVGGYGLTGLIERIRLRLRPVETSRIKCRRLAAGNLSHMFSLFREHDSRYEFSVAWLDVLATGRQMGRGLLLLGDHALRTDLDPESQRNKEPLVFRPRAKIGIPFSVPPFFLNPMLMRLFNLAYHRQGKMREGEGIADFESFFYPLDKILNWNRLYGRPGFFQYQFVIPDPDGEAGVAECLDFLSRRNMGSFLAVLKRCGDDTVLLPFCRKGFTLALDIPHRPGTLELLDELDKLVLKYKGRVYLSKDARMKQETYRAMYPEHTDWIGTVRRYNPEGLSWSAMAERLELWKP